MVHSRFARCQAVLSRLAGPQLALALLVSTLAALRLRSTLLVQLTLPLAWFGYKAARRAHLRAPLFGDSGLVESYAATRRRAQHGVAQLVRRNSQYVEVP